MNKGILANWEKDHKGNLHGALKELGRPNCLDYRVWGLSHCSPTLTPALSSCPQGIFVET